MPIILVPPPSLLYPIPPNLTLHKINHLTFVELVFIPNNKVNVILKWTYNLG
jgi:hypothetical protein